MKLLLRCEAALNRIMDWVGALAACLLFLLVILIAWNVVARYAFQASSIGIEELSWHLYAAIFLLGIPFALRSDSHVRVDLLYDKMQPKTQAWIDVIGSLVFLLPFCLLVIWSGWHFTLAAYQLGTQPDGIAEFFTMLSSQGIGERSQDPGGLLNRWIIKGVIPFSFLLLLLAGLAFFIRRLNSALNELHQLGQ